MLNKVLKVGDKIELKALYQTKLAKTETKSYVSQVLDIIDDYKMSIAVPIENGHLVPLEIGSKYEMSFMTVSGMYMCKCEVTNRLKQNNLYFLAVDIISELKKDQRRQYFRFEKIIPLKYRVINDEEKKVIICLDRKMYKDDREKQILLNKIDEYRRQNLDATIVNISGGGVKFSGSSAIKAGTIIALEFCIDATIDIEAFGKVLSDGSLIPNSKAYEHRLEFVRISKECREKIVRYVFEAERRQRQHDNGLK